MDKFVTISEFDNSFHIREKNNQGKLIAGSAEKIIFGPASYASCIKFVSKKPTTIPVKSGDTALAAAFEKAEKKYGSLNNVFKE